MKWQRDYRLIKWWLHPFACIRDTQFERPKPSPLAPILVSGNLSNGQNPAQHATEALLQITSPSSSAHAVTAAVSWVEAINVDLGLVTQWTSQIVSSEAIACCPKAVTANKPRSPRRTVRIGLNPASHRLSWLVRASRLAAQLPWVSLSDCPWGSMKPDGLGLGNAGRICLQG